MEPLTVNGRGRRTASCIHLYLTSAEKGEEDQICRHTVLRFCRKRGGQFCGRTIWKPPLEIVQDAFLPAAAASVPVSQLATQQTNEANHHRRPSTNNQPTRQFAACCLAPTPLHSAHFTARGAHGIGFQIRYGCVTLHGRPVAAAAASPRWLLEGFGIIRTTK